MGKRQLTPEEYKRYKAAGIQFAPVENVNVENFSATNFEDLNKYDAGLQRGMDQNALRASNQGAGSEVLNQTGRTLLNIIPTAIGNVGAIFDLEDYNNKDNELGNSVTRWAAKFKQNVDEMLPVYRENPNAAFDVGDSAWWVTNVGNLVESAAAFALTGAGVGGAVSQVGNVLRGAAGASKWVAGITGVAETAVTAMALNQAEALGSAAQVYEDSYQKKLQETGSSAEAQKVAADAAALTININRANVLLNMTSGNMFLRPYTTTRSMRKMVQENVWKSILLEGGQEYLEETVNYIAEKAGTAKADGKEYGFNEIVADMFSAHGIEAGVLGFAGGVAQTGLTKAIMSKSIKERNEMAEKQQKYIAGLVEMSNKAFSEDDVQSRDKAMAAGALNAFMTGSTEFLLDNFKEIEKLDANNEVDKKRIHDAGLSTDPDSDKYYVKQAKEARKMLLEMEKAYLKSDGDPNSLLKAVSTNRYNKESKAIQKQLNETLFALADRKKAENSEIDSIHSKYMAALNADKSINSSQFSGKTVGEKLAKAYEAYRQAQEDVASENPSPNATYRKKELAEIVIKLEDLELRESKEIKATRDRHEGLARPDNLILDELYSQQDMLNEAYKIEQRQLEQQTVTKDQEAKSELQKAEEALAEDPENEQLKQALDQAKQAAIGKQNQVLNKPGQNNDPIRVYRTDTHYGPKGPEALASGDVGFKLVDTPPAKPDAKYTTSNPRVKMKPQGAKVIAITDSTGDIGFLYNPDKFIYVNEDGTEETLNVNNPVHLKELHPSFVTKSGITKAGKAYIDNYNNVQALYKAMLKGEDVSGYEIVRVANFDVARTQSDRPSLSEDQFKISFTVQGEKQYGTVLYDPHNMTWFFDGKPAPPEAVVEFEKMVEMKSDYPYNSMYYVVVPHGNGFRFQTADVANPDGTQLQMMKDLKAISDYMNDKTDVIAKQLEDVPDKPFDELSDKQKFEVFKKLTDRFFFTTNESGVSGGHKVLLNFSQLRSEAEKKSNPNDKYKLVLNLKKGKKTKRISIFPKQIRKSPEQTVITINKYLKKNLKAKNEKGHDLKILNILPVKDRLTPDNVDVSLLNSTHVLSEQLYVKPKAQDIDLKVEAEKKAKSKPVTKPTKPVENGKDYAPVFYSVEEKLAEVKRLAALKKTDPTPENKANHLKALNTMVSDKPAVEEKVTNDAVIDEEVDEELAAALAGLDPAVAAELSKGGYIEVDKDGNVISAGELNPQTPTTKKKGTDKSTKKPKAKKRKKKSKESKTLEDIDFRLDVTIVKHSSTTAFFAFTDFKNINFDNLRKARKTRSLKGLNKFERAYFNYLLNDTSHKLFFGEPRKPISTKEELEFVAGLYRKDNNISSLEITNIAGKDSFTDKDIKDLVTTLGSRVTLDQNALGLVTEDIDDIEEIFGNDPVAQPDTPPANEFNSEDAIKAADELLADNSIDDADHFIITKFVKQGKFGELELRLRDKMRSKMGLKEVSIGDDDVAWKVVEETPQDTIEHKVALALLRKYVPESLMSDTELETLAGNTHAAGIKLGAVINGIAYMSQNPTVNAVYHEAFHVVFRNFLNIDQQNELYDAAVKQYGLPTYNDLAKLSKDTNVTDIDEVTNLWYEERMAEGFEEFMQGQPSAKRAPSALRKWWERLKRLFGFKSSLDPISEIYQGIADKRYVAATPINIVRGSANKLLRAGTYEDVDTSGNPVQRERFLSEIRTQTIVRRMAQHMYDKNYVGKKAFDQLFDQAYGLTKEYYSVKNWMTDLMRLDETPEGDRLLEELNKIQAAFNDTDYNYTEMKARVKTLLDTFSDELVAKNDEVESLEDEMPAEAKEGWMFESREIGGITSLSYTMRNLLAFATRNGDEFGIGAEREVPINPYRVYGLLDRLLSDTPKDEMLAKVYYVAEDNPEVKGALTNLLKAMGNENWQPGVELPRGQVYNVFTAAFDKASVESITTLHDPDNGRSNTFESHRRGAAAVQYDQWYSAYKGKTDTKDASERIDAIMKRPLTNENLEQSIDDLFNAFRDFGINLSRAYVRWTIYDQFMDQKRTAQASSLKLKEKFLDPDQERFYNTFNDGLVESVREILITKTGKNLLKTVVDKGRDPFIDKQVEDEEGKAVKGKFIEGIRSKIVRLAESNALFDETVGESTFINAEGKKIYNRIQPNYTTAMVQKLALNMNQMTAFLNEDTDELAIKRLMLDWGFDDAFDAEVAYNILKDNHFLNNYEDYPQMFNVRMRLKMIDGIRQTVLDANGKEGYSNLKRDGKAWGSMSTADKVTMAMDFFAGQKDGMAYYNFGVNAEKNTQYALEMPVEEFYNEDGITALGMERLMALAKQEQDRVDFARNNARYQELAGGKDIIDKFYHLGFIDGLVDNVNEETLKLGMMNKLAREVKYLQGLDLSPNSFFTEKNEEGEVVYNMPRLYNFLLNDFLNSVSFNQMIRFDEALFFKNYNDVVKRNSSLIAAGTSLENRGHNGGKIKAEILEDSSLLFDTSNSQKLKDTNAEQEEVADGQSMSTVGFMQHFYLEPLGKWNKRVAAIMRTIDRGIPEKYGDQLITKKENRILLKHDAQLTPRKLVYRGNTDYIKTSVNTLTRAETSIPISGQDARDRGYFTPESVHAAMIEAYDAVEEAKLTNDPEQIKEAYEKWHSFWQPLPHRVKMHNQLNKMEVEQIDFAAHASAVKMYKRNVGGDPITLDSKFMREQLSTAGVKEKVVDGSQKIHLISSEHAPDKTTTYRGKEMSYAKLAELHQAMVARRGAAAWKIFNKSIKNEDGTINLTKLKKAIENAFEASAADEFLQELANVDMNYNLNVPVAEPKALSIFNSFLSKNTLKFKKKGFKGSLVAPDYYEVLRKPDGTVVRTDQYVPGMDVTPDRLQYGLQDEQGRYYSEIILPAYVAEMFDLKPGEDIPSHVGEFIGIRIPTQDKHSMMYMKVVDVLPAYKGNAIILPSESTYLSGEDFDIDAKYLTGLGSYRDANGKTKVYGDYLKAETLAEAMELAKEEYEADTKTKISDKEFDKLFGTDVKNNYKGKTLKPITISEASNYLHEIETQLVRNEGNKDIADTAATMNDPTTQVIKTIMREQGVDEVVAKQMFKSGEIFGVEGVNFLSDKMKAYQANQTGARNIGIYANANILMQYLHSSGIATSILDGLNGVMDTFGEYNDGSDGRERGIINRFGQRINDLLSSYLSAATDNAKHQHASILNLDTSTAGAHAMMLMGGMDPERAAQIITHPVVKDFSEQMAKASATIRTTGSESRSDLTDSLIEAAKERFENGSMEDGDYVYNQFAIAYLAAERLAKINNLLGLVKGMKADASSMYTIDRDIKSLDVQFDRESGKFEALNEDGEIYEQLLNSVPVIRQNVQTYYNILNDVMPHMFLAETKVGKAMIDGVLSNMRGDLLTFKGEYDKVRKAFLSFMNSRIYRKEKEGVIFDNLEMLTQDTMHKLYAELIEAYPDNKLLTSIFPDTVKPIKGPFKDRTIYTFRTDTNKNTPEETEAIINAFEFLLHQGRVRKDDIGKKARKFAVMVFQHSRMKDGGLFRRRGLAKRTTPRMLTSLSKKLNQLMIDKDFEAATGSDADTLFKEFLELFGRDSQSYSAAERYDLRRFNGMDNALGGENRIPGLFGIVSNEDSVPELHINGTSEGKRNAANKWGINNHNDNFLRFPYIIRVRQPDSSTYKLYKLKSVSKQGEESEVAFDTYPPQIGIDNAVEHGRYAIYEPVTETGHAEIVSWNFTVKEHNDFNKAVVKSDKKKKKKKSKKKKVKNKVIEEDTTPIVQVSDDNVQTLEEADSIRKLLEQSKLDNTDFLYNFIKQRPKTTRTLVSFIEKHVADPDNATHIRTIELLLKTLETTPVEIKNC